MIIITVLGLALIIFISGRIFFPSFRQETAIKSSPLRPNTRKIIDFQIKRDYQLIPYYVDLEVGDTLQVIKANGDNIEILISSIAIESHSSSCPRTRVILIAEGHEYTAYCGMREPREGGIGPVDISGLKIGVEVTRLLFSRMKGGSSPFNTYERLKLQGDVRLAVWDGLRGITPGIDGHFVVNQPIWTRERFGNWLHSTNYGLHTAIDIFATSHGVAEEVKAPVDGTVYRVYNRDITPDDKRRSKAINIYGDATVGPDNEKILYRFHHFSDIFVSDGESVRSGQVIGLTGHTGFNPTIGDHLHFEIRLNPSHFGQVEDPNIFETIPVNPYFFLLEWYNADKGRKRRLERDDDK